MSTFKQEPELLPVHQATLWCYMFANVCCFLAWQVYAGLKLSSNLEESASATVSNQGPLSDDEELVREVMISVILPWMS